MKGALCLFFFILFQSVSAQEIHWKGKELQAGTYKVIEGEISICTAIDTITARKAILINQPKRAVLQGNVVLRKDGSTVTGDSGVYYPNSKLARVAGNAVIRTKEGDIFSESFLYNLNDRQLNSEAPVHGNAKGISFYADRGLILPKSGNIKLIGHAVWENDTIKGLADTIMLDKENQLVKMSRHAKIIFKKKTDELIGRYIEIDLKANKISRIEGSEIKRKDIILKASNISRTGEDYELKGNVEVIATDSSVKSTGNKASIKKEGMEMQGNTITSIRDKQGKEIRMYAPELRSEKSKGSDEYRFFPRTHIRGEFNGYADSLFVLKNGKTRQIFLYRNCHLQNDSLYLEGDTIEIFQDSIREIITAKRNAMVVMLARPSRVNTIYAAEIRMTKTDSLTEMQAKGDTESNLWNEEKGNVGMNHTTAPFQKARILNRKISRVTTKGNSKSDFQPLKKADLNYISSTSKRIGLSYQKDSLAGTSGVPPIRHFLSKFIR